MINLTDISPSQVKRLRRIIEAGNDALLLGIVDGCPPEMENKKCGSNSDCADCIKRFIRSK